MYDSPINLEISVTTRKLSSVFKDTSSQDITKSVISKKSITLGNGKVITCSVKNSKCPTALHVENCIACYDNLISINGTRDVNIGPAKDSYNPISVRRW